MRSYYKPGVWNVVCDVCGFEYKSDQLKQRWDGLMVCSKDWETRHPSDLLRVPRENPSVPWSRPEIALDSTMYVCTAETARAISGIGVAGCAVAGRSTLTG